jgi:hypothetical protein
VGQGVDVGDAKVAVERGEHVAGAVAGHDGGVEAVTADQLVVAGHAVEGVVTLHPLQVIVAVSPRQLVVQFAPLHVIIPRSGENFVFARHVALEIVVIVGSLLPAEKDC